MLVISVRSAADVGALYHFLRTVHVTIVGVEDATLRVELPGAPSALHERREIEGYVVTWNALNPGHEAQLVD